MPQHHLASMEHLKGLTLADPYFNQTRKVDLILDADIVDQVLMPEGHISLDDGIGLGCYGEIYFNMFSLFYF